MIPLTKVPIALHLFVSTIVFILWATAVALIVFGDGHGTDAGSVFLEVWICVFISLDIVTSNVVLLVRRKDGGGDAREETREEEIHATSSEQMSEPSESSGELPESESIVEAEILPT